MFVTATRIHSNSLRAHINESLPPLTHNHIHANTHLQASTQEHCSAMPLVHSLPHVSISRVNVKYK